MLLLNPPPITRPVVIKPAGKPRTSENSEPPLYVPRLLEFCGNVGKSRILSINPHTWRIGGLSK